MLHSVRPALLPNIRLGWTNTLAYCEPFLITTLSSLFMQETIISPSQGYLTQLKRLSTVDLLIKIGCFCKKKEKILFLYEELN